MKPPPPKPPVVAQPAPPPQPAKPASGPLIQIGAFPSAAEAENALRKAAALGGRLAGKERRVERVTVRGAVLHRAQLLGFGSAAEAKAACAQIRASGADCFVK